MAIELVAFNVPQVFMRLMEYLPKKDQKSMALTCLKYSQMAYSFNFWYHEQHTRKEKIPTQLVALYDQNNRALPQERDPQLSQKMSTLVSSVPKNIETEVRKFCTALGVNFFSKVEADLTKFSGQRMLQMIKKGPIGENSFKALSTFRDKALPLIEAEIKKYEVEEVDEALLEMVAAYKAGTLPEFVQEYRDDLFESYRIDQAQKRIDVSKLANVDDETLIQYSRSLVEDYENPEAQSQRQLECQRFKAVKARLVGLDQNPENQSPVQLQAQPEPLSLSPTLNSH